MLCFSNNEADVSALHLQTQMRKGFERVATDMPDIQLDLPTAPAVFADLQRQVQSNILPMYNIITPCLVHVEHL